MSRSHALSRALVREDAAGDLVEALRGITASRNGGHGVQFDENGNGVLSGRLTLATTVDNTGAGVQAEQAISGTGTLLVAALSAAGNALGDLVANAAQVTVTRLP